MTAPLPMPLAEPDLLPDVAAMVRCVREVIETVLAPQLTGQSERSTVASIRPTLRYVERLIEGQGQLLLDEERRLLPLLADAADWLEGQAEGATPAAAIRADLAIVPDAAIYPSLALMGKRVAALRQHVAGVLVLRHAAAGNDARGDRLHGALRDYMAWQIEAEGRLIEDAFRGQGPRR